MASRLQLHCLGVGHVLAVVVVWVEVEAEARVEGAGVDAAVVVEATTVARATHEQTLQPLASVR